MTEEKLKTLKEIEEERTQFEIQSQNPKDSLIFRDGYKTAFLKSRQEAIKHIKSNKIATEVDGTMTHDQKTSVIIKSAQTDWIKHFFNISDEELK